jgi:hypothetical protein
VNIVKYCLFFFFFIIRWLMLCAQYTYQMQPDGSTWVNGRERRAIAVPPIAREEALSPKRRGARGILCLNPKDFQGFRGWLPG